MGDILVGFFTLVGLGAVIWCALHGLAAIHEPPDPYEQAIAEIKAIAEATKAAMHDVAGRRS